MQAHYGSPNPPGGAAEMARLLTRTGERLPFALIAERDGALLGLASLSPVLFGGAFQWMLFLKDLYVSGASRAAWASGASCSRRRRARPLSEDYCRIDWTTDGRNAGRPAAL